MSTSTRPHLGAGQRSDRRIAPPCCGGRSLTSCREATSGPWIRPKVRLALCGCSSAAEQGHAMARTRVRTSSFAPLRVCPCTPRSRDMVLMARDVRGPWPDHVQRDTTSDGMLAFGHSRSGNKEPLSSSCFEGGNRPQGLGGAGTRDRMAFLQQTEPRQLTQEVCHETDRRRRPVLSKSRASGAKASRLKPR